MKHVMRYGVWCFAWGLGMAAGVAPAAAPPPMPRTLVVTFPSAEAGVQLQAYWTPPPASGKSAPAIVALHGCGGLPSNRALVSYPKGRYVKLLHDAGAGVLYVDSLGPRGSGSLCAQKPALRSITETNRRLDALGAMQWLAAQPAVDAGRLGVLGWSHGGQTVLATGHGGLDVVRNAPLKPAALVAFYPGCHEFEKMHSYVVVAPLLLMSGELDNWTPAEPCRRWTQRLMTQGQPVKFVQYEGSYHAFDGTSPVTERDDVGGTKSGRAMAGGNPAAREASAVEMMRFFAQHLGLKYEAEK